MRTTWLFCLFLISVFVLSCSKAITADKSAPAFVTPRSTENQHTDQTPTPPAITLETNSQAGQTGAVSFDGTNFIKKLGWLSPPHKDTYVDDSYAEDTVKGKTKTGKAVKVITVHYIFNNPWVYSEDFTFDGPGLDYLRGKVKSSGFMEMRVNGKIFMYTIFGEKNVEPQEDGFVYQIQDRDGDGIFETLLSGGQDVVVPNWVLK